MKINAHGFCFGYNISRVHSWKSVARGNVKCDDHDDDHAWFTSPEPMAKAPWAVTRVPKVRLPDNLAVLPWPIPEELIEEILTYLPPITVLCNLRSASRTWRRFIDQQCNAWRNAYFGLLHRFVQAHRKDNHLTFWRFASLETVNGVILFQDPSHACSLDWCGVSATG